MLQIAHPQLRFCSLGRVDSGWAVTALLCIALAMSSCAALLPSHDPKKEMAELRDIGDRDEQRGPYEKPVVKINAPPPQSVRETEPCKSFRAIVERTGGPCALEQGANKECTPQTCPNCAEYVSAYSSAGAIPGCL